MDEIFGRNNFVSTIIWEKKFSPQNDARWFSDMHDFILVYAKSKENFHPNLLPRTEEMNKRYKNPDGDPRGPWTSGDCSVKTYNSTNDYPIVTPSGRTVLPPNGYCWRFSKEKFESLVKENKIWFGQQGDNVPRYKRFLSEVKNGLTPTTIWRHSEVGHNQDAKKEVKQFNEQAVFATPKPEKLIRQILEIASQKGDVVLDTFLGSGTTAAVAQKMGRNYIGIEMGNQAGTHCVPRLEKVIEGEQGGISKEVNWQGGGGFSFYKLGERAFDKKGRINPKISFEALASFIWQQETGTALEPKKRPLLGTFKDLNIFLLYNGVLGDKRPEAGNVLTPKILKMLETEYPVEGDKLIYGEAIFGLSEEELKAKNITFKQIPYDIR